MVIEIYLYVMFAFIRYCCYSCLHSVFFFGSCSFYLCAVGGGAGFEVYFGEIRGMMTGRGMLSDRGMLAFFL